MISWFPGRLARTEAHRLEVYTITACNLDLTIAITHGNMVDKTPKIPYSHHYILALHKCCILKIVIRKREMMLRKHLVAMQF